VPYLARFSVVHCTKGIGRIRESFSSMLDSVDVDGYIGTANKALCHGRWRGWVATRLVSPPRLG